MWSFNVARSLVQEAGLKLIPEHVPKADEESLEIAGAYVKARPADTRCVVKLHTMLRAEPGVIVIRNKRELRDRLFSYFQFLKVDFDEQAIGKTVAKSLEIDSHYDRWPADRILNVSFESIETHSFDVIRRIAAFIGLPDLNEGILRDIDYRFSKRQVRKQISDLENRVFDGEGKVRQSADPEAIVEVLGQVRAFDADSGFQSGHVSDYRPGDWQRLWTDRQKQMVDDAIGAAQRSREAAGE